MFGKARQWLTARLGSKQQDPLRLFVHRHPMYQSVWQPIVTPDKQPGLQIQIYLEASNMAAGAYWIVAAEIADMPPYRRSLACVTPSRTSSRTTILSRRGSSPRYRCSSWSTGNPIRSVSRFAPPWF